MLYIGALIEDPKILLKSLDLEKRWNWVIDADDVDFWKASFQVVEY